MKMRDKIIDKRGCACHTGFLFTNIAGLCMRITEADCNIEALLIVCIVCIYTHLKDY